MEFVNEFKKEVQDTDCALSEKQLLRLPDDKSLSKDKNSAQKSTGASKSSAKNGLPVKKKQSKRNQPEPITPSHSRVSLEDSASMEFINEFKKEIQDTDGFDCAVGNEQSPRLTCDKTLSRVKNSAQKSNGASKRSTENGLPVKKKRSKRNQPESAAPSTVCPAAAVGSSASGAPSGVSDPCCIAPVEEAAGYGGGAGSNTIFSPCLGGGGIGGLGLIGAWSSGGGGGGGKFMSLFFPPPCDTWIRHTPLSV